MNNNILKILADCTRVRVEKNKQEISSEKMKAMALAMNLDTGFPFEKALKKQGMSFICEIKKASPSKGVIAEEFPYKDIAVEYEQAGASAISVLTETDYFLGSDKYLNEISKLVNIPILRKDFTIDEYMIYQAKVLGASAVLLICSLLDTKTIKKYIKICDELGLSALVEAHNIVEIESAVKAGARIIGVNNRNLNDFNVDINNCIDLRNLVSDDIIFVGESGIKTAKDIKMMKKAKIDAVLIGETFMRSNNKKEMLENLKGGEII
ncbi:MAG: indole-3-glycerol phosphate synthase TrpC [Acutalibacteraceae bacterium]|nr:indole-3-glycerol phosphate synthase TrpC [Acutalibacteraceae bacterium]